MNNNTFNILKNIVKKSAELLEQTENIDMKLNNNEPTNQSSSTNNVTITSLEESSEYTNIRILGRKARFKLAKETSFKLETQTGAMELDATLDSLYLDDPIFAGCVSFSNSCDITDDSIKERFKNWLKVSNINIENINKGPFIKHLKVETSDTYCENYCMMYDTNFDGKIEQAPYEIYIIIPKNKYSIEQINKMVSEFHLVIDSFELLGLYE